MSFTLEFLTGVHAGRTISLQPGQNILVGRGVDCDVQLRDHRASRRHCTLRLADDGLLLTDLDSTNGTLLNGAPVHVGQVPEGSRICIGETLIDVRLDAVDVPPSRSHPDRPQEAEDNGGRQSGDEERQEDSGFVPPTRCSSCGRDISLDEIRKGQFEVKDGSTLCKNCFQPPTEDESFAETMPTISPDRMVSKGDEIEVDELDGFEVQGQVGLNFLGPIYHVHHEFMRRDMLLVFLLPSLHRDEKIRERFRDTGRLGARYQHTSLVRVFELGPSKNTMYASIDAHANRSLWDQVKNDGPMRVDAGAKVARGILEGLQYLHGEGRVHGDLSPGKVLLGPDGGARLSFFDLYFAESMSALPSTAILRFFNAPEVHSGDDKTPQSDLYQMGALIFYALTGKPPRPGLTTSQLAMALPPSQGDDLPDQLFELLAAVLRPNPAERIGSAEEAARLFGGA